MKALSYQLVHKVLLKNHHNGVLLKCLEAQGSKRVLHDLHDGPVRGHFKGDIMMRKVMQESFHQTIIFKYYHTYACKCLVCEKCIGHEKKSGSPLQPIALEEPFQ